MSTIDESEKRPKRTESKIDRLLRYKKRDLVVKHVLPASDRIQSLQEELQGLGAANEKLQTTLEESERRLLSERERQKGALEQSRQLALAADSRADQAEQRTHAAISRADQAEQNALAAISRADQAEQNALAAISRADQAEQNALAADSRADQAEQNALAAQSRADQAEQNALAAISRADQAEQNALAADSRADQAEQRMQAAQSRADQAEQRAADAAQALEAEHATRDDIACKLAEARELEKADEALKRTELELKSARHLLQAEREKIKNWEEARGGAAGSA